jgi:hypothetical protein
MADGYQGPLDWTGLPAGAVSVPASAGFVGAVDWIGLPVGVPSAVQPIEGGGSRLIEYRKVKQRFDEPDEEDEEEDLLVALTGVL